MDLQMPVMNGYESSKSIKDFDPQAKILLVTGHPNDQLVKQSLNEGYASVVIAKPCDLNHLNTAVSQALQN